MSIRIYALAKQLKIESKALVDVCNRAGITGKGSALASLSDDEVATIRTFMADGQKAGVKAVSVASHPTEAGTTEALRREDYVGPGTSGTKKVPVMPKTVKKPVVSEPPAPESPPEMPPELPPEMPPELPPEPVVEEPDLDDKPLAAEITELPPTPPPVETPSGIELPLPPDRPEFPRDLGRLKDLDQTTKSDPSKKAERPERTGPTIKLAPLPKAKQPVPKKSKEPTPQKPDLKLPIDAIKASKAGTKPLGDHLRKQEEKRKSGKKRSKDSSKLPPKQKQGTTPPSGTPGKSRTGKTKANDDGVMLGGREQRQLRRKRSGSRRRREEDDRGPRRVRSLRRTGNVSTAAPRKGNVIVQLPCTVRSFSEALGLPAHKVLGKMLELNVMANINDRIDQEVAELLAEGFETGVTFRAEVDLESQLINPFEQVEDDPEKLQPRPPVVTFLGHVDHGKTSLLDRIIDIDVVSGEKGGITQHIRAYRVEKDSGAIAFVDTPGHEAFTAMRKRGANCTDIAVLVVAADDGVMPQTEEAISHARAAEVPIIVALNKIDLPGVNTDRALQELAANELLPSEWGGDVEVIRTSATTGEGVDDLLETLLTLAELHEFTADPERPAMGICLEAEVQQGRGVVAKVLVQAGTLQVGDVIVCGEAHGRVKAMYDTLKPRKKHKQAGPSTPVNLVGLDVAPSAGERFYVLSDISQARQIAEERAGRSRQRQLGGVDTHVTLENLFERLEAHDDVQILNIIVRADVRGSIEAIRKELTKLDHPEVQIKIMQATVGGITEADVHLADASDAVIIGFNVVPDEGARQLADQCGVQIRRYDIIYQVTEDLKAALEGMLKPERREADLGRALVQRIFSISRIGTIAGCRVLSGTIQRDVRFRVIRDNRVIGDYPIDSLRREKDDVREVREGMECGIKLASFNDLKEGDLLEAYKIEEIARSF